MLRESSVANDGARRHQGARRLGTWLGVAVSAAVLALGAGAAVAQTIEFEQASYEAIEGQPLTVCLVRTGPLDPRTDALVSSRDGTATSSFLAGGIDFEPLVDRPFFFFAGDSRECATFQIFDDGFPEGPETFELVISRAFTPAIIGTRGSATVTIRGEVPVVDFEMLQYRVTEGSLPASPSASGAGFFEACVLRSIAGFPEATEIVVVGHLATDSTYPDADEVDDHLVTSRLPIIFPAGSAETRACVEIAIVDDDIAEELEAFGLVLFVHRGGVEGTNDWVNVLIDDDDSYPGFELGVTAAADAAQFKDVREIDYRVTVRNRGDQLSPPTLLRYPWDSEQHVVDVAGGRLSYDLGWYTRLDPIGPGSERTLTVTTEVDHAAIELAVERERASCAAQGGQDCRVQSVADWVLTMEFDLDVVDVARSNDRVIVSIPYIADPCATDPEAPGCCVALALYCVFHPSAPPCSGAAPAQLRTASETVRADRRTQNLPTRSFLGSVRSLATMYAVRGRLDENPGGRRAIALYERHDDELTRLLLGDAALRDQALATLDDFSELLRAAASRDDSAIVGPQQLARVDALLTAIADQASPELHATIERERGALGLGSFEGLSSEQALRGLNRFTCEESATVLCLNEGRFRVEARWRDFARDVGAGQAVTMTEDTGSFWFFEPDNVELVVKVLDARGIDGTYWVFYGSLSNVEYWLTVTDTETGVVREYHNPEGEFASVGDVGAFDPAGSFLDGAPAPGAESSTLYRIADLSTRSLRRGWRHLRNSVLPPAHVRLQRDLWSAGRPASSSANTSGGCVASATALCLNGGRFRVEVGWRDFDGNSGDGMARSLTGDTGTFWFFDSENVELILKVLDARAINDRFWVFYGALSNVEYTITVTDTETGAVRVYRNDSGDFISFGDTEAF